MRKLTTTIHNGHNLIKKKEVTFGIGQLTAFLAFHASMRVAELALPKNNIKPALSS